MNILLIQREGIDLHHTLFASETSRLALRFYLPKKKSCGVYITVSTLGSALSLVSESALVYPPLRKRGAL